MNLKFDFAAELPIRSSLSDIVSLTGLFPRSGRRAMAFGWIAGGLSHERYWLADVGPEGVIPRILPAELTERLIELTQRPNDSSGSYIRLQAFGWGDGAGLLFGTHEVHVYDSIHAEPRIIAIDQELAPFAGPRGVSTGGCYPVHCGHAAGHRVPVVVSAKGGAGEGRHACVLEIDAAAGRARWLGTDESSAPFGLRADDYAKLLDERQVGSIGGPSLQWGQKSPLILDCALIGGHWHLYVGGYSRAYHRQGLAPSVLSRNGADLSVEQALFQAREDSFGRLCASGDRLILTPLRKNGPGKGKETIYHIGKNQEVAPVLPRGYTKHSIVEYADGCYWLLPMPWGYAHTPLIACSEK